MKFTRYIALAALLIGMVFEIAAIIAGSEYRTDQAGTAVSSPDTVAVPSDPTRPATYAVVVDQVDMALVPNETWVHKSVGRSPMNIFREAIAEVTPLDGYGRVLLKPKIGFTGVGADHYARADV
jgi:hypothetical protein